MPTPRLQPVILCVLLIGAIVLAFLQIRRRDRGNRS